jgi:hypothetical protein
MTDSTDSVATTQAPARDENGRWLPGGASPNPKGGAIATYPRDWRELRDLAQSYAPEAIEKLVAIIRRSRSQKIQLAAIDMLLDRAYGKPQEILEVSTPPPLDRWTPLERARRLAWLLDPAPVYEPLPHHQPPLQLPEPETRQPQLIEADAHVTANAPTDSASSAG